ncbi:hypothetical protein MLD38_030881 [Melastoma candidum]|uniref:Uncharacterized protein n=2 Tax=Melastoma candidum TaxID=119954 RepID=A0ACB9MP63_9MYRT|nr:hypothetical protein MLD38_030881 [Melastoma candidum]
MQPPHFLRQFRRLCTAATPPPPPPALTISQLKSRLRSEFDPDKALQLVTTAFATPSLVTSASVSSLHHALSLAIRRLSKSHRPHDALSFLSSLQSSPARSLSEPLLSSLIVSYSLAGMFEHSLLAFRQMDSLGVPRSASSLNAVLSAALNCGLHPRARQLFDELSREYGISPDEVSYGILVKSHCAEGFTDRAIDLIRDVKKKGVGVTVVAYTTVLNCLYKEGRVEDAEKLWDEMVKGGCEPDVAAYNVRLRYAQNASPEEVSRILAEMGEAGLRPDAVSYNCLITAYCMVGKMEDAKKVYREELGGGRGYDKAKGASKCNPNAATYRTMVHYWCRNGEYENGYKVFKESVSANKLPDFGTLKGLVEGLVKQGKVKEAKGVVRTVEKKFPPNLRRAWTKVTEELGLGKDAENDDEEIEGSGKIREAIA